MSSRTETSEDLSELMQNENFPAKEDHGQPHCMTIAYTLTKTGNNTLWVQITKGHELKETVWGSH